MKSKDIPPNITVSFDAQDAMDLAHTLVDSFFQKSIEDYDILHQCGEPQDDESMMLFYETHLEALMFYKMFAQTGAPTVLAIRETDPQDPIPFYKHVYSNLEYIVITHGRVPIPRPTNPYDALVLALTLALTAPDDARSERAVKQSEELISKALASGDLDELQVERAKREARRNSKKNIR